MKKRKKRGILKTFGKKGSWFGTSKKTAAKEGSPKKEIEITESNNDLTRVLEQQNKILASLGKEKQRITIEQNKEKKSNLAGLIILLGILAAVYFLVFTDSGQIIGSKIFVGLEPGYNAVAMFLSNGLSLLRNPVESFGSWKNPSAVPVEKIEDAGIIINSFETTKDLYSKNNDVILIGDIGVKNLEEDTTVDFVCEMTFPSLKDEDVVVGNVMKQPEGIYSERLVIENLPAGKDQNFNVLCKFEKGEIANYIDRIFEEKKDEGGDYVSFTGTVSLKSIYPAKTRSRLRLYTIDKELSDKEIKDFRNSISKEGLLFNNRLKSQTDGGPMNGFLDIKANQPITEAGNYLIDVGLRNTKGWKGKLFKLSNVEFIRFPKGVKISEENCEDFVNEILKNDVIECYIEDKQNKQKDCGVDLNNIVFNCAVDIGDEGLNSGSTPEYEYIQADLEYDYAISRAETVNFRLPKN